MQNNSEIRHPAIRGCLEYMKMADGLEIHHDGDLPGCSGMGSSAAFTVGLLHCLHALKSEIVSKRALALEAMQVDQDIVGETVGCYSEDTEILTRDGWCFHSNLSEGQAVLTLNLNTGLQEYQPIEKIWRYRWNRPLLWFKSKTADILVTEDHNMLVKKLGNNTALNSAQERLCFEKSQILFGKLHTKARLIRRSQWIGKEKEFFELPGYANSWMTGRAFSTLEKTRRTITRPLLRIKMDDWLAFLGLYISEGSLWRKHYGISIWQKERRPEMEMILKCLPFNVFWNKGCWHIMDCRLNQYLKHLGLSSEKYVPREFLDLPARQLEILLRSLMLGDGHIRKDGRRAYYTSSKQLADDVQEIFQKIGREAVLLCRNRIGQAVGMPSGGITRYLQYEVLERRDYDTRVGDLKRTFLPYNGIVWCITVPNHTLYVRRNGNAIWCGNCQDHIASAFGGLNRMDFSGERVDFTVTPIPFDKARIKEFERYLMLFFTGISRHASEVAARQVARIGENGAALERMTAMVTDGQRLLMTGQFRDFGLLLEDSWQLKRSLGASNSKVDTIHDAAMRAGALSTKILGAGEGGFMLVLTEPDRRMEIRAALGDLLMVPFEFEAQGSQVVYYSGE